VALRIFTEPQQGASYDELLAVARLAESSGFDAFFRSDHILKMGDVSGLPGVTDAWITLAGLARDTSRIRLGTLVTPVTFRQPGMFAVIAAQVDQMSGGRVDIGLGAGWYGAEHEAFGLPFPHIGARYDLLEDQLAILHGAWTAKTGETVSVEGRTTAVSIIADTIRTAQHLGPPIVLGGQGKARSARLAATYAAEYNVGFQSAASTKEIHDLVRSACEAAGRDPATMVFSAAQVVCCGENDADIARRAAAIGRDVDELRANGLAGTPADLIDKLGDYREHGVGRFYLQVLDLNDLDHLRLIAEQVQPHAPSG
jgi:F420-dependent oxidoreductase-like protein